jgi:hypothetical protein
MGFKKNRYNAEESEHKIFPEDTEEKTPEVIEEKKPEVIEEKKPEMIETKKEIEKPVIAEASELGERKLNCGITGDTLEVKEFRAIVKKQGKQINVVITDILSDWNQKNYNL